MAWLYSPSFSLQGWSLWSGEREPTGCWDWKEGCLLAGIRGPPTRGRVRILKGAAWEGEMRGVPCPGISGWSDSRR